MSSKQVLKKIIPVEDAISVLHDGDVLASSGYGGHGMPEGVNVIVTYGVFTRCKRLMIPEGSPRLRRPLNSPHPQLSSIARSRALRIEWSCNPLCRR